MVKNLRPKSSNEEELIQLFGLKSFLNKKLGNLSGGTKQKVNIVLTFMFNSDLIILDEPTTGLDPIALIHLKELIQKEKDNGKTILITTHIMSVVEELADEIADVIFTLSCLANSLNIDLDEAFERVMDKCYGRDKNRFEKK